MICHMILSYINVGIEKIHRYLKVMTFSIKCALFCSHGKLVPSFLNVCNILPVSDGLIPTDNHC